LPEDQGGEQGGWACPAWPQTEKDINLQALAREFHDIDREEGLFGTVRQHPVQGVLGKLLFR
jgi:hypothetical protein